MNSIFTKDRVVILKADGLPQLELKIEEALEKGYTINGGVTQLMCGMYVVVVTLPF